MSYDVKKDGPVAIFTGSLARVAMVKDLLATNGIESFVQNEFDPDAGAPVPRVPQPAYIAG